jgi:hypothetical protein
LPAGEFEAGGVLSAVTIKNDYPWMLDPRFGRSGFAASFASFQGRFTAYVDGKKTGVIELGSTLRIEIAPDEHHTVRVRKWWYRSPSLDIRLGPQEDLTLYADLRMGLRSMAHLLFRPSSSLYLGEKSLR